MARRTLTVAALAAVLALVVGCAGAIGTTRLVPRLSPPVIARPGVLRAAIDLGYPPFGGSVKGQRVGLDVDVAAAIADQLGLTLEIVDATPTAGADLARNGKVDIVMGGLTVEQAVSLQLAYAGTYVTDSSAVFGSNVASLTLGDLSTKRIAVQNGSVSYWNLLDQYGEGSLVVTPTLLEAMQAVVAHKADIVAGDALVAAYIGRQVPGLRYGGQLAAAYPIGVGVAADKAKLETEVRTVLDKLSSQGVLETLRRKWAGELPRFTVPSSDTSPAASATPAPTP